MLELAPAENTSPLEEIHLNRERYDFAGLIRGVTSPGSRFLTVKDAIDALYMLINQQLDRVDRLGKRYSPSTSKVFAPEDNTKRIGGIIFRKTGTNDVRISPEQEAALVG